MLSFMLNEESAARVNKALDKIAANAGDISRSEALLKLADAYLQYCST